MVESGLWKQPFTCGRQDTTFQNIPQKAKTSKNLGWHGIPRVKESREIGSISGRPGAKPHTMKPKEDGKIRKSRNRTKFLSWAHSWNLEWMGRETASVNFSAIPKKEHVDGSSLTTRHPSLTMKSFRNSMTRIGKRQRVDTGVKHFMQPTLQECIQSLLLG